MNRLDDDPRPLLLAMLLTCAMPTVYDVATGPTVWPMTKQVLGIAGSIAMVGGLRALLRFALRLPMWVRMFRDVGRGIV